jgi:hypothetical protein
MALAVVFAVVWAFSLIKKKEPMNRWLGLSLTMIGLHYTIYVITSYFLGTIKSVWLVEIWTIPVLGLGLTILLSRIFVKKLAYRPLSDVIGCF